MPKKYTDSAAPKWAYEKPASHVPRMKECKTAKHQVCKYTPTPGLYTPTKLTLTETWCLERRLLFSPCGLDVMSVGLDVGFCIFPQTILWKFSGGGHFASFSYLHCVGIFSSFKASLKPSRGVLTTTGVSPTKECGTVSHVLSARVYEAIYVVTTVGLFWGAWMRTLTIAVVTLVIDQVGGRSFSWWLTTWWAVIGLSHVGNVYFLVAEQWHDKDDLCGGWYPGTTQIPEQTWLTRNFLSGFYKAYEFCRWWLYWKNMSSPWRFWNFIIHHPYVSRNNVAWHGAITTRLFKLNL